jgi:hypothetical protein
VTFQICSIHRRKIRVNTSLGSEVFSKLIRPQITFRFYATKGHLNAVYKSQLKDTVLLVQYTVRLLSAPSRHPQEAEVDRLLHQNIGTVAVITTKTIITQLPFFNLFPYFEKIKGFF